MEERKTLLAPKEVHALGIDDLPTWMNPKVPIRTVIRITKHRHLSNQSIFIMDIAMRNKSQ